MLELAPFLDMAIENWIPLILRTGLIIILGLIIHNLLVRYVSRLEEKREIDRRVIRQIGLIARYVLYLFLLLMMLSAMGVTPNVVITSLGIIGIAAGFAAQDLLSNILSGVFLIFENTIKVSDLVRIGDVYGIVRIVKLRTTEIRTFDGNIVNIPNSLLSRTNVVNMTSGSKYSMTAITLKLAYEADFDMVKVYMKEIAGNSEGVLITPLYEVKFELTNIGERYHGMYLTMFLFVEAYREPWIRSEVHKKILDKLVAEKVPFHRDSPK